MRNYAQLFAICKTHGFDYKDKVAEFTGGKHCSLKKLTDGEYKEFMLRLSRLNEPARKAFASQKQPSPAAIKPGQAQRRAIISIARQMGWEVQSCYGWQADMQRINNWCLAQKFKKGFMQHSPTELNTLLYILQEKVLPTFYSGLNP